MSTETETKTGFYRITIADRSFSGPHRFSDILFTNGVAITKDQSQVAYALDKRWRVEELTPEEVSQYETLTSHRAEIFKQEEALADPSVSDTTPEEDIPEATKAAMARKSAAGSGGSGKTKGKGGKSTKKAAASKKEEDDNDASETE